ncbi:MAG: hypothetical protein QXQ53_01175 [Candidatus Methanosuratincola sp.]
MPWTPPERNFDGVQFETLRKEVDKRFNDLHDELSDCYYNHKPFRHYGILSKELFDKLHGLIFLKRDVAFHEANLRRPPEERIPTEKYDTILNDKGEVVGSRVAEAQTMIDRLKSEGIALEV